MNHRMNAAGVLFALGLFCSGCSILPRFGPAPEVGPPSELAGSGPADADSVNATPAAQPASTRRREKPDTPRQGTANGGQSAAPNNGTQAVSEPAITTRAGANKDTLNDAKGTIEARPSASDSTPPRTLSIELPEEERARLETQALQDIEAAEQLAAEAKIRSLSAAEEEKLLTVLGLIDQAEVAREGQDLSAASNLARKARLLAAELIPK